MIPQEPKSPRGCLRAIIMPHRLKALNHIKGFTLSELVLSMFVLGLVSAGIASFYIYSLKSTNVASAAGKLVSTMNFTTNLLQQDMRSASRFEIYESFDSPGNSILAGDGEVGDFLVLYYADINGRIFGIRNYYLSYDEPGYPQLKRYEMLFDPPLDNYQYVRFFEQSNIGLPAPGPPPSPGAYKTSTSSTDTLISAIEGRLEGPNVTNEYKIFKNNNFQSISIMGEMITENPSGSASGPAETRRTFSINLVPWSSN